MPKLDVKDTICAIATPLGEGGIGVVRLSGPEAIEVASGALTLKPAELNLEKVPSHTVHYGYFQANGSILDEVMVAVFRAPRSYTAEDVVEISAHGSTFTLRKILDALVDKGARIAQAGEFTKRAFINGRIDLAQAEAVLDMIKAKSARGQKAALDQLQGRLSRTVAVIKEELIGVCAYLEAHIDFPDEDLDIFSEDSVLQRIHLVNEKIARLVKTYACGEFLRDGILTVLVGCPNVGKSSLLNALLDRDRAIISDIPGTTRDALEELLDIQGLLVRLVDTAGLGVEKSVLDKKGIEKTISYFEVGKLFLFLLDGTRALGKEDKKIFASLRGKTVIPVITKADLECAISVDAIKKLTGESPIIVSSHSREGLEDLETAIADKIEISDIDANSVMVTRLRHKISLEAAREALIRAGEAYTKKSSLEFIASDLREALTHLGEVVGEIYTDDILDVIFSEFCIGK